MDREHRELLRRNRSYIRDNVADLSSVLDKLLEKDVLSSDMIEEIQVETKSRQAFKMLDIIPKRGSKAFKFFIESLNETGNEELADHLREGTIPVNTNYTVKEISQPKMRPEPSTSKPKDVPKTIDEKSNTLKENPSCDTKRNDPEQKNWIQSLGVFPSESDMNKTEDKFYGEMNNLHQNDMYHMVSRNKGKCFILSTYKYTCNSCRDNDKTCLQCALKNSGFEILKSGRNVLSKSDIQSDLQKKLDDMRAPVPAFVMIVVTSGKYCDRIYCTSDESEYIDVGDVIEMLKACSVLSGKPKVILLHNVPSTTERCRADDKEPQQSESVSELGGAMAGLDLEDDKFSLGTTNTDDIYVVSCTPTETGNFLAQGAHGSYFVCALAHCLQIHAHNNEFLQLMEKLDHTLRDGKKALCCYTDGLDNLDAMPLSSEKHKGRLAKVKIISRPEKKKFFIFPGFDGAKGSQAT